jgi:hypothetical protein
MNARTLDPNPLDEAFIDWLTRVSPDAHQLPATQRDLMEMTFFAGAALSFGVAEQHGAEAVMSAIKLHTVRLQGISARAMVGQTREAWRERLHADIDRMALEAHVDLKCRARAARRDLGLTGGC